MNPSLSQNYHSRSTNHAHQSRYSLDIALVYEDRSSAALVLALYRLLVMKEQLQQERITPLMPHLACLSPKRNEKSMCCQL